MPDNKTNQNQLKDLPPQQEDGIDLKKIANAKVNQGLKVLSGAGTDRGRKMLNNVLAFMSTSGGTGASTIVASLATLLDKDGFSVIVVDMNIMYPSQHIYFDIKQTIQKNDLITYLSGKNAIGGSIEYHGRIGTLSSNNRGIIDYVGCDNELAARAMSDAIDRLSYLFDVVLIDVPNDVQYDAINMVLYKADNIYFVMDDGVQSLINIQKIKNNFEANGIHTPKIKYIMNKRTSIHYPQSNLDGMNVKLEEIIPFEMGVIACGLRGQIFLKNGEATSKTSKEYIFALQRLEKKILANSGYRGK